MKTIVPVSLVKYEYIDGRAPQRHIPFFQDLIQNGNVTIQILRELDDVSAPPVKKSRKLEALEGEQHHNRIETIKFSKALLSSSSPVLAKMLSGQFADGTEQYLKVPAPDLNTLYLVLWWMLTNNLPSPTMKSDGHILVCMCIQLLFPIIFVSLCIEFKLNHGLSAVSPNGPPHRVCCGQNGV